MDNIKVIRTLEGHPSLEVHQKGEDFALYIPLSEDYITQFGEYTDFGPYVYDCIGVKSAKDSQWGIITLESEIVLPCIYGFVAYPYTVDEFTHLDACEPDGLRREYVRNPVKDHDNEIFFGFGDWDYYLERNPYRFDCLTHEEIIEPVKEEDEAIYKDWKYDDGLFGGLG